MPSSILCHILNLHRRLEKMDASLKVSFSKVKHEISNQSRHLRYIIAKLTEQEKLNKQLANDIASLQKQQTIDIDSLKRTLKEEIMRDIGDTQSSEKSGQDNKKTDAH